MFLLLHRCPSNVNMVGIRKRSNFVFYRRSGGHGRVMGLGGGHGPEKVENQWSRGSRGRRWTTRALSRRPGRPAAWFSACSWCRLRRPRPRHACRRRVRRVRPASDCRAAWDRSRCRRGSWTLCRRSRIRAANESFADDTAPARHSAASLWGSGSTDAARTPPSAGYSVTSNTSHRQQDAVEYGTLRSRCRHLANWTKRTRCSIWFWPIRSIMCKHDVIHKTGST